LRNIPNFNNKLDFSLHQSQTQISFFTRLDKFHLQEDEKEGTQDRALLIQIIERKNLGRISKYIVFPNFDIASDKGYNTKHQSNTRLS
jgi:hypothetical protein